MNRAQRDTAEFNGAFRDLVGQLLQFRGDLVEQLMQADEVRAFYVPVRLLRLQAKIKRVGEVLVKQFNDLAAGGLGQVVLCRNEFGFHMAITAFEGMRLERVRRAMSRQEFARRLDKRRSRRDSPGSPRRSRRRAAACGPRFSTAGTARTTGFPPAAWRQLPPSQTTAGRRASAVG